MDDKMRWSAANFCHGIYSKFQWHGPSFCFKSFTCFCFSPAFACLIFKCPGSSTSCRKAQLAVACPCLTVSFGSVALQAKRNLPYFDIYHCCSTLPILVTLSSVKATSSESSNKTMLTLVPMAYDAPRWWTCLKMCIIPESYVSPPQKVMNP